MIIHIGYPKAASSHIQEKLFKHHPEINYLNVNYPSKIYENIYRSSEYRYREAVNFSLKKEYIDNNLFEDKINIIADERFTSNMIDYGIVAKRLNTLFPKAKILVIIRNQLDILRSRYDMHPYSYLDTSMKWLSLNDWLKSYLKNVEECFLNALFYDRVINKYMELFGKENVKTLLFEDIIGNEQNTLEELFTFLQINDIDLAINLLNDTPTNIAGSHYLYHLKLKWFPSIRFSRFIPTRILKLASNTVPLHKKTVTTAYFVNKIYELYKVSNTELSEMLGKDLRYYNYPL